MRVFVRLVVTAPVVMVAALSVPAGLAAVQQQAAALTAADADRFERKYQDINRYGAQTQGQAFRPDRARRTVLTEAETNSYLRFKSQRDMPKGMVDPCISALGGGRLTATAVLDLDAVRQSSDRGSFDLIQLLSGRLPVTLTGVLRTRNGIATFGLESSSIAGIPVPKMLLQQVVAYYSRSPEHPNGIGLDDQFVMPFGIREIDVQLRQAVVVQ